MVFLDMFELKWALFELLRLRVQEAFLHRNIYL